MNKKEQLPYSCEIDRHGSGKSRAEIYVVSKELDNEEADSYAKNHSTCKFCEDVYTALSRAYFREMFPDMVKEIARKIATGYTDEYYMYVFYEEAER